MKVIEKIRESMARSQPFFSLEFFPPKTNAGLLNLYSRIDRLAALEPLFVDVTWGAGGQTDELSLLLTRSTQLFSGLDVMMHLTCTNMSIAELDATLDALKEGGVSNILALRGDPVAGSKQWTRHESGFSYAYELTRHIRQRHGDHFGIAVAGYPEGHPEAPSKEQDAVYLKQKVDAGADLVITQLFYDVGEYVSFVQRCRHLGITCPIIPGVMPIHSYERFHRFTEACQIKVPPDVREHLEAIKNDDFEVQKYGVSLCVEMCRELLRQGAPGLHFYTLNLEAPLAEVLVELGVVDTSTSRRALPWRPSTFPNRREEEDVRPIFWSNRPESYVARTMTWDRFPNGRWGPSQSPTFGDLDDYYLMRQGRVRDVLRQRNREILGDPTSEEDVRKVFVGFCRGEVSRLPWCSTELRPETRRISDELTRLNESGLLTINSQPRVNGASSSDPDVGWGGADGVVFQKAYLEFFVSAQLVDRLIASLRAHPSLTYQCVNSRGEYHSNVQRPHVNAVTWGVFPGAEIAQPTIVDSESFLIWKDEAFDLWKNEWESLYDPESVAAGVLRHIRQSYYLVNVVDNNFTDGDLFAALSMD